IGIPSDMTASSTSSTGVPCSIASMMTRVIRVSTRLTTKPGASSTRIGRLRSCSPTAQAVASASSDVSAARTTSSSGITATGLKKAQPEGGRGRPRPGASAGKRRGGGVGRGYARVGDARLERGEHVLLARRLLKDRLEHELAAVEALVTGTAGDRRTELGHGL